MTADEVQTLIGDVPCDLCNTSPGLAWYLVLAALIDVANGDPVPTTTQGLITEANCLTCLVPSGLVPYLMIQALRDISAGGGGSGGVLQTTGNPEGVLTSPTANSVAYDCSTGALYYFCGVAGANTGWQTMIGP